jgi:hypothetical protein
MRRFSSLVRAFFVFLAVAALSGSSRAQAIASTELPDAPEPQQATADVRSSVQQQPDADSQTKRILGIFPNFRAVSASTHLPPQSVKEKFVTASQDSFDYSAFVVPMLLAGYHQETNETPEFHQGGAGYARYFWHDFVDQTDENYMVEFIVPTLTHEDTRYYTLGRNGGGGMKRIGYALSRAVVTRNDAGHETFNASEVVGAGAAAGIANLYYPSRERTLGNTVDQWTTNIGIDAAAFIIREFWPDINHSLFHGNTPTANH